MLSLPEWFTLIPGFRWFDSDGDICILLGWEPECQTTTDRTATATVDGETYSFVEVIYRPSMTYVTWHKNSWMVRNLEEATFDGALECPDDHRILDRLMSKDTFKYMNQENA